MKRLLAAIVWLLLYSSTFGMEAWETDHTRLLQKYVKTSGVGYAVWKENSADVQALKDIISQIGATGPSSQKREAQLAYYINAYNALVLAGVLDRYPIRSVRDVAPFYGFFTQNNITVAGKKTSLYALERKLLIPKFTEPRIHFAINCASRSCPPLRRAFPIDSGRIATGAHVPRRREPLWHGVASENDLSSRLCCPTQCPRYQRRFAHSLPLNSACSGIPPSPILGTAARLTIIWRKFVSTAAGVFRRRKIRRS